MPNAVVARRVLWRTRAEVASLRVAVESRMSRSRRWPPGSRVGPGRSRGRGGSCGRHPRVDAVVVVDRRRSRSSWRFVTHVIVWRCPTDIRCFQGSNNCSPPEHPQLLGCRDARGISELFSCLFFVLFLVSKLSWLVRNVNTACKQIQQIKMRRGRDAQGEVMEVGPSPRYVVGGKEVRRFFCDGEHDRWVIYLSSTWRNRHQIP